MTETKPETISVAIQMEIPEQRIKDLLTGGIESACGYWLRLTDYTLPETITMGDLKQWSQSEMQNRYAIAAMFPGTIIHCVGIDGEGRGQWQLTRFNVIRGLQIFASGKDVNGKPFPKRHWDNFISENDDDETADVFMQLCILGEIVYG